MCNSNTLKFNPFKNRLLIMFVLVLSLPSNVQSQAKDSEEKNLPELPQMVHPSKGIIIAVLSTMFAIAFLLLLYVKFCRVIIPHELLRQNSNLQNFQGLTRPRSRVSGIDKQVIETLPYFKFSSLKGSKEGLECTVCLSKFEDTETLRLLPKRRVEAGDMKNLNYSLSSRFLRVPSNPTEDIPNLEIFVEREPSNRGSSRKGFWDVGKCKKQEPLLVDQGGGASKWNKHEHVMNHKIVISDVFTRSRFGSCPLESTDPSGRFHGTSSSNEKENSFTALNNPAKKRYMSEIANVPSTTSHRIKCSELLPLDAITTVATEPPNSDKDFSDRAYMPSNLFSFFTLLYNIVNVSLNKRTLLSLMDTEKPEQPPQSPVHLRVQTHREISEQDVQFSPPRPSSTTTSDGMFPMMMPDSPWTLSPLPTPSPSLLYHCIASLHRHEGNIYAIAASKGLVFTGSNSSRIRVWKQPDCMDRGYLKASSGEVRAILAYSNMLFSTHKDHKIRIWTFTVSDSFKSKKVGTLPRKTSILLFPSRGKNTPKHKDSVSCMAYYHSEGLLYTGSHDRTVKAWRVSDRKCVDSFVAHEDNVNAILVNQDDGCLFPGSSDGMINFWEKERLCYRFNHGGFLQGHRFAVLCLATVGNMIFSGSEDTTIRVWRREEGSCYHECLTVLDGHRGPVKCLAACLEMEKVVMGFLVYSASLDQTFKVWRIKVLPDEKMCMDYSDQCEAATRVKIRDYDMSPVLSPSWVEKKLQGSYFQ
ncbi:hypothetical protein JHK87_009282 [Glycine soja]|nr:hypothetical protein JHK87_009282 [Glycine soja]